MDKITAKQLVEAFTRFLADGWGYVYGGQGELYSEALAQSWTAKGRNAPSGRNKATYFISDCAIWYGHRVADCSGGIVEAFRLYMPEYSDRTADTFFSQCSRSGEIDDIPEVPGLCVWKKGHIGVYVGDGYAIEFRGTSHGCVKTRVKGRTWTHWGMLREVEYEEKDAEPVIFEVTSPYQRGEVYGLMQQALAAAGYPCGAADKIWGPKSEAALLALIQAHLPETISATISVAGREYKGVIGR